MKPAFLSVVIATLAPTAWAQRIGPCSGQSIPQEFEPYCQAPETNPHGSLEHYRIAELLFGRNNLQSALNEFRPALDGDLDPKWTEVWAHIGMGRIYGTGGQIDRALKEYKPARRTGDNTLGAQDEVTRLVKAMGIEFPPSRILDLRTRAKPIEASPADYTEEAAIAELEGTVLLEGVIGADGQAQDLTVLRPLGLGLDESAIAAVRQWLFDPGRTDGQDGSNRRIIAVDFLLSSKRSRWHLIRADFKPPSGGVGQHF